MANQTLTLGTPSARINFDSATLSGLANGETITINGGHLLFDGDNRWGNNAAVVDSMPISSTLGGSILIDGRNVWEVPFSTSTGNVPTVGVAGSNAVTGSGITGELFRVWATGSLTPAAAGGAMPATGWIKLRSKTGDFSNGLVVTLPGGATITCSGAGKRSWINVVAEEAGTVTVPRLGTFTVRGDWYELGTTSGADDQTFQYPIADNCPAIQIETAEGSGVYEWYLNAGSRWATATQFVPTDVRGKYFGMVNTTGIITIANRATNACGFKPATGCKVRVPNVMLSNSNATDFTLNTIHGTLATRYDFTTTAAGVVDIEFAACNWYLSLTNAYRVVINNTAILQSMSISNTADTTVIDDVAVGLDSNNEFTTITITNCFTSVTLNRVRAVRYAGNVSGSTVLAINDVANYTETNCQMEVFGALTATTRGNATIYSRQITRLVGVNNIISPIAIGGFISLSACSNVKITNTIYADLINGISTSNNPSSALSIQGTINSEISGFSSFGGLSTIQPYSSIVTIGNGCQSIKVQNIGTPSAPYNCDNIVGLPVGAAVTLGLELRRLYFQNVRTGALNLVNTVQNVVCDNVWGDATDAQSLESINLTARGCRWTNSVSGASSVYGRHWEDAWTSTTAGRLLIICNEPTTATADQCQIVSGTPMFTSSGQVIMQNVGDEVVWIMPYFVLGVTGLSNSTPTVTGTNATFVSGNNWTNFFIEFQYDTGTGFNGTWLPLNGPSLSSVGVINPNTGIKLKVRAITKTASTSNALLYLRINTVTDEISHQIQYPLPQTQLTITGFEPGTDIVVYDATIPADGSGSNVIANGVDVTGTFVFEYSGTPQVRIGVFKSGFVPQVSPVLSLNNNNSNYTVQQRIDRNYA